MSSINNRRFIRKASKLPTLGVATKAAEPAAAAPQTSVPGSCSASNALALQLIAAERITRPPQPEPDDPVPVSQVENETLQWVFPGWIPAGCISILFGEPGVGKSQVSLDIAARLSTGRPMPNPNGHEAPSIHLKHETKYRDLPHSLGTGEQGRRASNVLLFSAEDSLSNTIKPRLVAANADCDRIRVFPNGGHRVFADPIMFATLIVTHAASLVIVDPLTAYVGSHDIYRDQHVRRMLAPLAIAAEQTGAAILLIHHVNKSGRGSALMRSAGSLGITAAARSVMMVGKDPGDPSKRVLAHVKGNLGPPPSSLRFHFVQDAECEQPRIEWDGAVEDVTADSLFERAHESSAAIRIARTFLIETLSSGPMPSKQLEQLVNKQGISKRTFERVRPTITKSKRIGGIGGMGEWHTELLPLAHTTSA